MVKDEKYDVTGMSCAACSARVDKAVRKIAGVSEVSVNLLMNSMLVSYDNPVTQADIIAAVEKAGYGAKPVSTASNTAAAVSQEREALEDHETPKIRRRLIVSLVLLTPLLYITMGHGLANLPAPAALVENPLTLGLYELLLSAAVMIVNQKFFVNGFRNALSGGVNMDTLVALGSTAGFVYSSAQLFSMTASAQVGDWQAVIAGGKDFYFETSAMILALITVGKMLESMSKGRTTNAIKGLMDLAPKTARLLKDGQETIVPVAQVAVGDVFRVLPGESFPVDGVVLEGESAVNEAALTGESLPVDKTKGSFVSAATINQNGALTVEARRVGNDTTLQQIIEMVQNAAASKAEISKMADRVAAVFVPVVIAIAVITGAVWLLAGQSISFALARAVSVLVISCPCALGLATPVAIMVGSGKGAKAGILFKTAASLEETGKVDYVVLDKTGTITEGKPVVTDLFPVQGTSEDELLAVAASLEAQSEHPLAKAIQQKAQETHIQLYNSQGFQAMPGHGVEAKLTVGNEAVSSFGGSATLFQEKGLLNTELQQAAERFAEEGKTPLLFALRGKAVGLIAVADKVKEDSKAAIEAFSAMGIQTVMLTGDNERTAKAVGRALGLSAIVAGVLPDGKEKVVAELKKGGKVAMVGDGINDAPALTRADIGIAIGAGADVAIDAADVVLMKSSLMDAVGAVRLSRQTLKNIKENLFWAFFYNVIGIPLAAGLWYPIFGIALSPLFGAAAMGMSSVCVVSNALRLNLFNLRKQHGHEAMRKPLPEGFATISSASSATQTSSIKHEEESTMEKTIDIKGMMCAHCVAHVTKALEGLDGVTKANVSLEKENAVVDLSKDVADKDLTAAIVDAGYEVVTIH